MVSLSNSEVFGARPSRPVASLSNSEALGVWPPTCCLFVPQRGFLGGCDPPSRRLFVQQRGLPPTPTHRLSAWQRGLWAAAPNPPTLVSLHRFGARPHVTPPLGPALIPLRLAPISSLLSTIAYSPYPGLWQVRVPGRGPLSRTAGCIGSTRPPPAPKSTHALVSIGTHCLRAGLDRITRGTYSPAPADPVHSSNGCCPWRSGGFPPTCS